MSLENMMSSGLPLNRKERFYTGTVFPMIVCAENFRYFGRFTSMLPGFEPVTIDWSPGTANVQFFTEYSNARVRVRVVADALCDPAAREEHA